MKIYVVGGAVRDRLMGLTPKDIDYLIVGATETDINNLVKNGYEQVGVDFPVFIHPVTKAEYALARIERKTGVGYTGFTCETKNVKIEDDLKRRDLTINAMAYDQKKKEVIDPYNGQDDLKNKILRHVSEAFKEDPLRVLRIARFNARYHDFNIHPSTISLIKGIVSCKELKDLSIDRIHAEIKKAISEEKVGTFLTIIKDINAWDYTFINIKTQSKAAIQRIEKITNEAANSHREHFFWYAVFNEICKKPQDVSSILEIAETNKIEKTVVKFAKIAIEFQQSFDNFKSFKAQQIVEFFDKLNVKNNGGDDFLYHLNSLMITTGSITYHDDDYIFKCFNLYSSLNVEELIKNKKLNGKEIKSLIQQERIKILNSFLG